MAQRAGERADALEAFFTAAGVLAPLLRRSEVAAAWGEPSALAGLSVGGVAGHLVMSTTGALDAVVEASGAGAGRGGPEGTKAALDAARFLGRARVDSPAVLESSVHVWIRDMSERMGRLGPEGLAERFESRLVALRPLLAPFAPDSVVVVPVDTEMGFEEYMRTRVVELLVHADDLVASVPGLSFDLPPDAVGVAIEALLAAVRAREGDLAVLRALSRAERAPGVVLRAL